MVFIEYMYSIEVLITTPTIIHMELTVHSQNKNASLRVDSGFDEAETWLPLLAETHTRIADHHPLAVIEQTTGTKRPLLHLIIMYTPHHNVPATS